MPDEKAGMRATRCCGRAADIHGEGEARYAPLVKGNVVERGIHFFRGGEILWTVKSGCRGTQDCLVGCCEGRQERRCRRQESKGVFFGICDGLADQQESK